MNKFNLNIKSLIAKVSKLFSFGKNSTYKGDDIACRLIDSAVDNQSLEAMHKIKECLSGDRVLNKLHTVSTEQIEDLMNSSAKKLKLPKSVNIAIDFHDKIFYGNKKHFEVMGSKGGNYVKRYIETSLTNSKYVLSAYPVNQFTNDKVNLIHRSLDGFHEKYNSKIKLVFLDRGFFSKKVINYFCENKIKFIMPAVKDRKIKVLSEQFKLGKISSEMRYKFGNYEINLLFLKVGDEIHIFMTNTKHCPFMAALLYKKRWQIETNFREQNNFLFKTKTLNFTVRYFAFILACLLFNLWHFNRDGRIESYLFKKILREIILEEFRELIIFSKEVG